MKYPIFRHARTHLVQSGFGPAFALSWIFTIGVLPAQSEQVLDLSGLSGTLPAESMAVWTSTSGFKDVNQFLGANRYYNYSTPITGQNSITYNLEAGHIWNGHEALGHVTQFTQTSENVGGGAVSPLYDRHATWVGMLIGGRQTIVNPQPKQQGIAPLTDLRSAAIASQWVGLPYSLSFKQTPATFVNAFNSSFGVADVVNSSWGFTDPTGTDPYTVAMDAYAWNQPGTTYVTSAGNSGPGTDTVGSPGAGYNSITVGALTRGDDPANPYDSVASFSSRSPQSFSYYNASDVFTTLTGVRAAVDIAAPGDNLTSAFYGGATGGNTGGSIVVTANSYSNSLGGTSFAAPLVAGGAALMASAAHTLPQLSGNLNATHSMVVKSLLLTGADKTAGWSNGLATVTESGKTFLRTTQSLDWAVGAGRMNLDTTFDLQLNGTRDVAGTATGLLGQVASKGWDYGWANRGVNNDYVFSTPFDGMSQFDTTLSWQRVREFNVATLQVFDRAQANLTVSFWSLNNLGAFDKLIAESASLYNTVEHLSFKVPATGQYGLRVSYPDNTFDRTVGDVWGTNPDGALDYYQEYGIAWSMTPVPETSTLLPLAAMFSGSLCLRVRRKVRAC